MEEIESEPGIGVAVYGATGALGRQVLLALEGYGLPIDQLVAVGGVNSAGREAYWRGRPQTVVGEQRVDIADLDVAILAVPAAAAQSLRRPLIDAGVFVVDLAASGGEEALPLMLPSLDMEPLETHPGGVAIPCGIAGALAPLLKALEAVGTVAELDVTALMSAQSVGRRGEEALSAQTLALLNQRLPTTGPFGGVLAFNLLPGSAWAEASGDPIAVRAIEQLGRLIPSLVDVASTVRVIQIPVFAGLGLAVRIRFDGDPPTSEAIEACFEASDELRLIPDEGRLALRDAMEHDGVFLARPERGAEGTLHVFAATDPLHRSAWAVGAVLEHALAEDLW
jgi:aspartate-semialdehyde dehydrogenase